MIAHLMEFVRKVENAFVMPISQGLIAQKKDALMIAIKMEYAILIKNVYVKKAFLEKIVQ